MTALSSTEALGSCVRVRFPAGVSARRPPLKTAFGGANHHHGPCEPSLRSLRTGLRRGGAKIPEIRKHPPETGPQNRPENRVNTPPEGSRDSFRQRKPLTLRRFHKNRRMSSQGRNAWPTT